MTLKEAVGVAGRLTTRGNPAFTNYVGGLRRDSRAAARGGHRDRRRQDKRRAAESRWDRRRLANQEDAELETNRLGAGERLATRVERDDGRMASAWRDGK